MTRKELISQFNMLPEITQWSIRFIGPIREGRAYYNRLARLKTRRSAKWILPKYGEIRLHGIPMNDPRWDILGEPIITTPVVTVEEIGSWEEDRVFKATTRSGTEYLLRVSEMY
jgi:hypothetical protein